MGCGQPMPVGVRRFTISVRRWTLDVGCSVSHERPPPSRPPPRQRLSGLSRGLALSLLDTGFGEQFRTKLSFFPTCQALGLVMPSNSPAVNSLWLPAIALKTPVVIKPGREEPWTPWRLIQAFIAAGCPAEAFGFYPADHEGAAEILKSCGRALIFGDKNTTAQ